MKRFVSSSTAALSIALSSSCGKGTETPPPQRPPPNPAYGQPGQARPPQYGAASPYGQSTPPAHPPYGASALQQQPGQVAPLGTVLADPQTVQTILAGALAGGAAVLGALTGGEQAPIAQGIQRQAAAQAKGMKVEGQLMTARLGNDGHAEGSLTLQPGSCYTIIGFAGPGVFDYQINVVTAPPAPPQVLAQSSAGSVTPVVGPNEQCVQSPYPLPLVVRIDMHVLRGQGMVGAQAYRR